MLHHINMAAVTPAIGPTKQKQPTNKTEQDILKSLLVLQGNISRTGSGRCFKVLRLIRNAFAHENRRKMLLCDTGFCSTTAELIFFICDDCLTF